MNVYADLGQYELLQDDLGKRRTDYQREQQEGIDALHESPNETLEWLLRTGGEVLVNGEPIRRKRCTFV